MKTRSNEEQTRRGEEEEKRPTREKRSHQQPPPSLRRTTCCRARAGLGFEDRGRGGGAVRNAKDQQRVGEVDVTLEADGPRWTRGRMILAARRGGNEVQRVKSWSRAWSKEARKRVSVSWKTVFLCSEHRSGLGFGFPVCHLARSACRLLLLPRRQRAACFRCRSRPSLNGSA
jgi:hypothetical protein